MCIHISLYIIHVYTYQPVYSRLDKDGNLTISWDEFREFNQFKLRYTIANNSLYYFGVCFVRIFVRLYVRLYVRLSVCLFVCQFFTAKASVFLVFSVSVYGLSMSLFY